MGRNSGSFVCQGWVGTDMCRRDWGESSSSCGQEVWSWCFMYLRKKRKKRKHYIQSIFLTVVFTATSPDVGRHVDGLICWSLSLSLSVSLILSFHLRDKNYIETINSIMSFSNTLSVQTTQPLSRWASTSGPYMIPVCRYAVAAYNSCAM